MKINHIATTNFLGARALNIYLRKPIALLIGRNGAGKSSTRDALALALTKDVTRARAVKDAAVLITEGQSAASVEVGTDIGNFATAIAKSGRITDRAKSIDRDPMLSHALNAALFMRLTDTERRALLMSVMRVDVSHTEIAKRLLARGLDETRVKAIAPLLRTGFDAAAEAAKAKAAEARGAWRSITGETYGDKKAEGWKPNGVAQAPSDEAIAEADETLTAMETSASAADARVATLMERARNAGVKARSMAEAKERAEKLPKLEAEAAECESAITSTQAEIERITDAGGPREGLIHDLAALVCEMLSEMSPEIRSRAETALDTYEATHGPLEQEPASAADIARLPSLRRSLEQLRAQAQQIANGRALAQSAKALIDNDCPTHDDAPSDDDITAARNVAAQWRDRAASARSARDALKAAAASAKSAADDAEKAQAAHAAVQAWVAINAALMPDGVQADLVGEAIKPLNDRLAQSAADTSWPLAQIHADMSVTFGGRPYSLCSVSEQWRVEAMVAEALVFVSGTRLLVLDGFDVLEVAARSELIGWLDVLADNDEIDTVIAAGTLAKPPADLPPNVEAHWIDAGVCGEADEAQAA